MNLTHTYLFKILLALVIAYSLTMTVNAHMMVAQQGTLRYVDGGVYMVISIPVSAMQGIDDDQDGKLSQTEFEQHRPFIVAEINEHIILKNKSEILPLRGMMLSLADAHDAPDLPSSHLIVMGRYSISSMNHPLTFHAGLFGKTSDEAQIKITASHKNKPNKQVFTLTPKSSEHALSF